MRILIRWIKNGITSAFASGTVDTVIQYKNVSQTRKRSFNTTEVINAYIGGFVSGFITGSVASIPNVGTLVPNLVGGFSGSITSQLLYNIQNGVFLSQEMGTTYMYGAGCGLLVGALNTFYHIPIPSNIDYVL